MLPIVVAALTPFVKDLFANGLNLLGNAVMAKGKAAVEDKLGVKLPSEGTPMTPEQAAQMRALEFQHEEKLLELGVQQRQLELDAQKVEAEVEKVAEDNVTDRWKADMASDSWLAKNVRPMTLIYVLAVYTIFSIASAFGINVNVSYVELLGQWGMLIMTAYFAGRTVEKMATTKWGGGK